LLPESFWELGNCRLYFTPRSLRPKPEKCSLFLGRTPPYSGSLKVISVLAIVLSLPHEWVGWNALRHWGNVTRNWVNNLFTFCFTALPTLFLSILKWKLNFIRKFGYGWNGSW